MALRTPADAEVSPETSATMQAACEYIARGIALVPVGRGKRPYCDILHASWRRQPDAPFSRVARSESLIRRVLAYSARHRATREDVRDWLRRSHDVNISAICGRPSDGLVVLDLDTADPEGCDVPLTPRVTTPRGSHIHLKTERTIRSCDLYFEGRKIGHVIGEGGYAPLPPSSSHTAGVPYKWAEGLSPADLGWHYSEPPAWVLDSHRRGTSPANRVHDWLTLLRAPLTLGGFVALLWLLSSAKWFLPGLMLMVFGEMLQMWAASHLLKQGDDLTTSGPYAHVRNPMYCGRFFLALGATLMSGSAIVCGVSAALFALYATDRVKREERRLHELYGQSYDEYCKHVPRWIPGIRPYPDAAHARPRWTHVRRNREHHVALGLTAAAILIYLKLTLLPGWHF